MSKAPICPQHNISMRLRTTKDGHEFYGCPRYPKCDETASTEDEDYGDDDDIF